MTPELIQTILAVLGVLVTLATLVGNAPYVRGTAFGKGLLKMAGVDVVGIAKILLPLLAAAVAVFAASKSSDKGPKA
jgi:hypothetical protein